MEKMPEKHPHQGIKVAYILVWFPKASETFVFREVCELMALGRETGLQVEVFTLYAALRKDLDTAMAGFDGPVTRLGIAGIPRMARDFLWWMRRAPGKSLQVLSLMLRRWRSLETTGESIWSILCSFSFARAFMEKGITHIHADWANGPATAAWAASRLTGIRFTFTGRAGDIFPPDGALKEKGRDCHAIRTDVARNVPYLIEHAGVPPEKVRLIHAALALTPKGKAALGFHSPFVLVAVGRFVPKKGFDVLLQAMKLLREKGVEAWLVLAGSGPLKRELDSLRRELGLEDCVEMPGFLPHDEVPDLLLRADCFVMSSVVSKTGDRDGIPNVILEAMAHGLPVVGTDVSGIGEVVKNGVTGLLVPPGDAAALADALGALFADHERAKKWGEAGRAMVLEQFDPKKRAQDLASLYAE